MMQESDDRDAHDDEPNVGRPGPTDQGRKGGMATREHEPELTKRTSDDD
jgi:hypothetical protein